MLIKCHTVAQEDRKPELTLLIQTVDELNNMSKVKVTEWFGMNVKLFLSYILACHHASTAQWRKFMARNPTGKPIASTYVCSYRWEEGEPKD